jgi:hypothetical protein
VHTCPFKYITPPGCVKPGIVFGASGKPYTLDMKLITSNCDLLEKGLESGRYLYSKSINSLLQPKPHHPKDSLSHISVIPIEVRLLRCEEMKI